MTSTISFQRFRVTIEINNHKELSLKKIITLFLILKSICFAQNFWEPIGFQEEEEILSIGINSVNGDIFIGTADPNFARIHLSQDNGNTWTQTGLTGLSGWINSVSSIDINSSGYLFASTGAFLYRSTDNGVTWQDVLGPPYCCFEATVFNSMNHTLTNAGDTAGILRSEDNGNTWTLFNQGLSSSNIFYDLVINSSEQIFAAKGDGIYRSNNNGEVWSQILSNVGILSIAFNSDGHIFGGKLGGIVRSTNNGSSWALSINFATSFIWSLLILDDGHIFACSSNEGIFHSTDNGDNWEQLNQGLTNLTVWSLALSPNGYLFAGTEDGIFRSVQPVTSIIEESNKIPSAFVLNQNYPNPFNSSSIIRYSVPHSSGVVIKVFDILGNEIETLVNEEKPVGTYEITWYAENLPSGVYFYRLQAGNFVETKKMILLK